GTECRAAAGECDLAEKCTGIAGQGCPSDTLKTSGAECVDDGNPCTVDQCDGSGMDCQHRVGNAGAVCRAAAGACDAAETCSGTSATCPDDLKRDAGDVCRPPAGACDVAETCDGTNDDCPADVFVPATTECRSAAGSCDVAEFCTGADAD